MNSVTFVNVSHPAEVQNHKVQTNIRRHVMRDIGRSRRKKARHKIVPMEFRALPENRNSTETPQITLQSQPLSIEGYNLRLYQSPEGSGILGMELDENAMQIVQFMIAQSQYKYRPFHLVWLRIGLSDSTAFQLSLASALLFKEGMNGSIALDFTDNEESAKHYFKALRLLSGRLSDPSECVAPGVVATVLGCICHDTIVGNWERWTVHTDGMMKMYKLRGGFDGMENQIPLMAFWSDLVGATVLDSTPRLPIPIAQNAVNIESLPLMQELLGILEPRYLQLSTILQTFQMMSSVAKTVNSEAHFPTFWKDEVGAIRLIGPVTHHLLSVARPSLVVNSDANVDLVRELVRLTCLMLLSRLKSRFSLNFLDMPPLQAKFRCAVAQISGNPDHELEGLILWALLTAALLQTKESRKYLLSHILISSLNKGFSSTLVTLEFVKELLWIDSIENEEKATLVEELEQYRRKPSRI